MNGTGGPSDAELVSAVLGGDRQAFAEVYDRYADRLHDFAHSMLRNPEEAADAVADSFVVMAEKLGQLRDPARLRPWLYSVVRHECLRMLRGRSRVAYGGDDRLTEMSDDGRGPDREAEVAAMRTLVWEAAAGLGDRDRALLDLHLRQGLEGAELAEAMGISPGNAYTSLNRLRAQVERSLGALLIAKMGRDDCVELQSILASWDGRFSPLVRKRVARHVDDCDVCTRRRSVMVSPMALLSGVPLLPAPALLRDRVLNDSRMVAALSEAGTGSAGGGSAGGGGGLGGGTAGALGTAEAVDRARRRKAAAVGGGGAVAAGLIVGLLVVLPGGGPEITDAAAPAPSLESSASAPSSEPPVPTEAASPTGPPSPAATGPSSSPTAPAPPPTSATALPAQLELSTDAVTIPSFASFGSVSVLNTGGEPLTFTTAVPADAPWLTAAPTTGTVPAGGSAPLDLFVDRARIPAGSTGGARTTVLVSWDGEPRTLSVYVAPEQIIERDPGDEPDAPPPAEAPPGTGTPPTDQTQPRGQSDEPPATDPAPGTENP